MLIRFYITAFLLIIATQTTNAQSSYYYYYKSQRVYLTLEKNYLNIITKEDFEKSSIDHLNFKNFVLEPDKSLGVPQRIAKIDTAHLSV
jgi:hypothetical protein